MICNDDQHNIPSPPKGGLISSRRRTTPSLVVSGDQLVPSDNGAAAGMAQVDTYLHALRRNWFWCLLLGSAFAAAAGAGVWLLTHERYTAYAELQAHSAPQDLVPDGTGRPAEKFETYISSVKQLITSRKVMMLAMRDGNVKKARVLADKPEPEAWLSGAINVTNPKDSEILIVSLTTPYPSESRDIVSAVVKSYLSDVATSETDELEDKKDKLIELREKLKDEESQAQEPGGYG